MMGVGKSSIGKSLSDRLNMNFIDIDKIIEKKEANTIKNIFQSKGEKYFRIVMPLLSISFYIWVPNLNCIKNVKIYG